MVYKMTERPPSGVINSAYDINAFNWDSALNAGYGFINTPDLFPTSVIEPGQVIPLPRSVKNLDLSKIDFNCLVSGAAISDRQFLDRRLFNDGLLVLHKGQVVHESYRNLLSVGQPHINMSTTKSFAAMSVARAGDEGLRDWESSFSDYVPEFGEIAAWDGVTLQHLMDMTSGLVYDETYADPNSIYWSFRRATHGVSEEEGKVIGLKEWCINNLTERECEPGTLFRYNSPLSLCLGIALENVYGKKVTELFEEKIFQPCGCEHEAWFNLDADGLAMTHGRLNLTLRDFARCAHLMLNDGCNLNGEQVVPNSFVGETFTLNKKLQSAFAKGSAASYSSTGQYHNQHWGLDLDNERMCMLGIHGQAAYFDRRKDLMIITYGSFPVQSNPLLMGALKQLWQKITEVV